MSGLIHPVAACKLYTGILTSAQRILPGSPQTYILGFQSDNAPPTGSMNPSALYTTNPFYGLFDWWTGFGSPTTFSRSGLQVSGFTANPGQVWLNWISANGLRMLGSSAIYSYSAGAGIAQWEWAAGGVPFGFANGGSYTVQIASN